MREQLDAVRCASTFIGVQGAGLSWYQFLPTNATFIELYWYGWKSKFRLRANQSRPDVTAHAVECTPVTPYSTWANYARRWLHYLGPVNDVMKQRLIERSAQVERPVKGTVWKDSNCVCSSHDILKLLP